jgi:hypothetical protein
MTGRRRLLPTVAIPRGLAEALWIGLTMRVLLSLFAYYVSTEQPMSVPCHFEEARNGWTVMPPWHREGPAFQLFGIWERWDGCWYVRTAAFGYGIEPGGDDTAFFPLLPVLMRIVSPIVGGDLVLAGIVVPTVALIFALWGIHRTVARDFGDAIADRTVLYVSIFPTALFFFAPYTESLSLATAVWAFDLARTGRWAASAVIGFCCGLTRPPGALLALPLAYFAVLAYRRGQRSVLPAIAAAAPVVALAAFSVYSVDVTGQSPLDAQRRWWGSPELHWPWEVVQASAAWIGRTGSPLQALDLVVLVGAIGLSIAGLWKLPLAYSLFSIPQVLISATRILPTPLTSTTRYLVVVFPLFVMVALLTTRPRAQWIWVAASLLMLALLAHGYLRGDFVARPIGGGILGS